jgi:hypothetical protein
LENHAATFLNTKKMASYKQEEYLTKDDRSAFDQEYKPTDTAPLAGIYRCTGCGREQVSNQHQSLPALNHHRHLLEQGPIRWKLIVIADQNPK